MNNLEKIKEELYKKEKLEKRKEEWYQENKPSGDILGYPECCIREFGNQPPELLRNRKPTKDDKRRYKAACINGKFTGFIPCSKHAKQILKGKITLQSLIDLGKRDLFIPEFPNA